MERTIIKQIQELLHHFGEYTANKSQVSLKSFGTYLSQLPNESSEPVEFPAGFVAEFEEYYQAFPTDRKIMVLLFFLGRFEKLYAKRALADLPLTTLEEFTYLVSLSPTHQPSKSELINHHYMEITSGVEIIKRLVKLGLVEEVTDPNDRRVKRLSITEEGIRIRDAAVAQMEYVSQLLVGPLAQHELDQLLRHLTTIHGFHNELYAREADQPLERIVEKYLSSGPIFAHPTNKSE